MCRFIQRINKASRPHNALGALVSCEQKCFQQAPESSFGGVRISDTVWMTVPGGRTSNWQTPGGGPTCWVGDVVGAVDVAQRNGDVCGWTVSRRGIEVSDRSDIDGQW